MEDNKKQKTEEVTNDNVGVFSARLEALISAALQDGVLTDKEREIIKIIQEAIDKNNKGNASSNEISNSNREGYYIKNGKKIILPTSTEVIKEREFAVIENLEKVVFPSSLVKIESSAFSGCTNLVELDFSQCLKLKEIGESVFLNCGLKSIDLSRCTSLETIGESAFRGCKRLTNIVFPNPASIQEIPEKMCYGLKALESVDLSKCTQLKRICECAFACTPNLKEVLLPDSIEVMEKWAMAESGNIKHINMPPLLKEMGYGVFAGSKIEAIDFSRVNLLKSIPEATFGQCGKLKSIILPSSLEEVGEYFFEGINTVLKNIDFSKVSSLEVIPSQFLMCDSIKTITIPMGVKTIEDYAFRNMSKLEKMFLPPTLEHFGSFGYYDIDLYCFAPQLDELEPLVDGLEPGDSLRLYVLPQYLRTYIEQRDAEGVSDKILSLQAMPDEYLYYSDN